MNTLLYEKMHMRVLSPCRFFLFFCHLAIKISVFRQRYLIRIPASLTSKETVGKLLVDLWQWDLKEHTYAAMFDSSFDIVSPYFSLKF